MADYQTNYHDKDTDYNSWAERERLNAQAQAKNNSMFSGDEGFRSIYDAAKPHSTSSNSPPATTPASTSYISTASLPKNIGGSSVYQGGAGEAFDFPLGKGDIWQNLIKCGGGLFVFYLCWIIFRASIVEKHEIVGTILFVGGAALVCDGLVGLLRIAVTALVKLLIEAAKVAGIVAVVFFLFVIFLGNKPKTGVTSSSSAVGSTGLSSSEPANGDEKGIAPGPEKMVPKNAWTGQDTSRQATRDDRQPSALDQGHDLPFRPRAAATANEIWTVTGTALNVRSEPDKDSFCIGTLAENTNVRVLRHFTNGWFEVVAYCGFSSLDSECNRYVNTACRCYVNSKYLTFSGQSQ